MKVYKVVGMNMNRLFDKRAQDTFGSCMLTLQLEKGIGRAYKIGCSTRAGKEMLENGYGLCVFKSKRKALTFKRKAPPHISGLTVLLCEAKKIWKPAVIRLPLELVATIKYMKTGNSYCLCKPSEMPFPRGTYMTDELRPIKIIRRRKP